MYFPYINRMKRSENVKWTNWKRYLPSTLFPSIFAEIALIRGISKRSQSVHILFYNLWVKSIAGILFWISLIYSGCVTKDVGKNLSNTKYMAKWGLLIDDQRCVITLKHSVLSNKKVIWFNDDVVKETKQFLSGDFDYTWSSMKHIFKIVISKEKKNYVYCIFFLF